MKKINLLVPSLFIFGLCSAQQIDFTVAEPQPDLIDVYGGSFASGDIDGDGDQDLLIAGQGPQRKTELYLNDGSGNFSEVADIPFPRTSSSVTLFEDLDSDGDLDLYLSGNGFSIGEFAHIYLNNGLGVFTQLDNPSLPQFQGKGVAIEDIDNDGDLDILISAMDVNDVFIADVYLNDGSANFTPSGNADFTPLQFASIAFIDIENDGDADVIISGIQENDSDTTLLYINDGLGNYTIDTNNTFEQIPADDIDVADTDNDGDLDILMSGRSNASEAQTILYINDGNGQFTELTTVALQDTFAGANAIADLDNDGDQDIVIVGSQEGGLPNIFNIVYENVGNNQFIQADIIGGEYIAGVVVDDFNSDGLLDIIIQGFVDETNVYWNSTQTLNIEDISTEIELTLYPNPTHGTVRVSASETILQITLYSILGQELFSINENSSEVMLDLSNQSTGSYYAKIETQKRVRTIKLVKQ